MTVKCAGCGKQVEEICSKCWRCVDCQRDCKEHMERTLDGVVEKKNKS